VGWVDEPDFSLYRRHLSLDPSGPRWRSNPHSPSGRLAAPDERADVWDEAFYPLATGTWTRGDGIVVGSLTKLFACPGLRVGYVVAEADLVERLARRQPQWSVNGLACAALPELLATADLPAWAAATAELRAALAAVLADAGFAPVVADGCWILVPDAGDLRTRLAGHRILVRDCTSFGMPGTVRVGVPSPGGLDRLSAALGSG
jgi:histidinol-phosphate/aromatic aminotransferase/cobyric acid decarboxylase-like protein